MWRRHSPLPLIVATIFAAATHAATSCFQNDPPYQIVRGQPFVLTWEVLTDNSVFDLSLATEEHESLGYLARNVTESSLIWTPPLNITSERLTFGLFWYDRQSMCYSPNFTVTGSPDASFATPSALLATTVVTNNRIASTVVATQGIWTPNDAALATATPTPSPSSAVLVQSNSSDSATDPWKIGVAVAISVLVLVVLILGGFLWRARRKRRDTVAAQEVNDKQDTKLKYENDSYRSSAHTAVDELDGSNRNELPASERAQLDGRTMPHGWKPGMEYTELNGHERYEADSHNVVAELPGDEPVMFPEKRKEG